MVESVIIGGGYSAFITQLLMPTGIPILTPSGSNQFPLGKQHRRPKIEANKVFAEKAFSQGGISFDLKNGNLHDRLNIGGNSAIWGGFMDQAKVPIEFIAKLKGQNLCLQPLSFENTGSYSNNPSIVQLQNLNGNIFNAKNYLSNVKNTFLDTFYINKDKIILKILKIKPYMVDSLPEYEIISTNKLILCIGTVQLLDLLMRSNYLPKKSKIKLTEFPCRYEIKLSPKIIDSLESGTRIRYHMTRALLHYLGIQRHYSSWNLTNKLPLYLDQIFQNFSRTIFLDYENKQLTDSSQIKNPAYGGSIHYCNMHINNLNINHILNEISPNIVGIGMPFVEQAQGGPISNLIALDAIKKCEVKNAKQ